MQAQSAMTCISAASSFSIRSRSLGPACATEIWFGRVTDEVSWSDDSFGSLVRSADGAVVGSRGCWDWDCVGLAFLYVPVRKDSVPGTDLVVSLSLGSGD